MRIAQISDSHISLEAPSRLEDLERCVDQINALAHPPDVAVHTGDVSHDGLTEQLILARRALERLRCPWFVIPGNKDLRQTFLQVFFDDRAPGGTGDFIQYAIEDFPIRLLFVDTHTSESNKGALCEDRLQDLGRLLERDATKPVAIFMHHPPFRVPVGPDPLQFFDPSEATDFCNRIARHENVRGVFCGHVHRPASGLIGTVPVTVMTASALDRRFGETEAPTAETPLYRIYDLDPEGRPLERLDS